MNDASGNETCTATKELLMGGMVEVTLECGREPHSHSVWHMTQETLEMKDGERVGYVQFHWREEPAE